MAMTFAAFTLAVLLRSAAGADAAATSMAAGSAAVGSHGERVGDILHEEIALHSRRLLDVNGTRPPAWHGRFDPTYGLEYFAQSLHINMCDPSSQDCSAIPGQTYPYLQVVTDPMSNGSNPQPVMKVGYPAGAWAANSDTPSGILFYAFPFKADPTDTTQGHLSSVSASLAYDVYFPPDFDWVKGGKLPGMSGGTANGRGCGGGADPAFCFSYRVMWRRDGMGEAYLYVPHFMQAPDFCTVFPTCAGSLKSNCTTCDFKAGVSFGRGSFTFVKGEWNRISMSIRLNNPNATDGLIELIHNDRVAISYRRINWRQTSAARIEGIEMASWFGGGDSSWGPQFDTYTLLKNFRAWRGDPPANATVSGSRSARSPEPQPQRVVVEKIIAGL